MRNGSLVREWCPVSLYAPGRNLVCLKPPTHAMTVGCVHEHVTEVVICERHRAGMRQGLRLSCSVCASGRDPHKCYVIGRAATEETRDE